MSAMKKRLPARWVICAGALLALSAIAATTSTSGTVEAISPMSVERSVHDAALLRSGQVLVTGGCGGLSCESVHRSAELFDPATRSFERLQSPMNVPRSTHASALLVDGRVFIAGGWTGQAGTASTEFFDPVTRRFVPGPSMQSPRIAPVLTLLKDGRVLVTGGEERTGASLASAEIFDPSLGRFTPAGRMHDARAYHAGVRLPDGRVLLTGGHASRTEVLRSAELFDPSTGAFTRLADMTAARHKHGAALLRDGRVLVVGGSDARDHNGRHASSEIFDPITGRFDAGATMRGPRHKITNAVATLPTGDVLVTGDGERAELYLAESRKFVPASGAVIGARMYATASVLPSGEVLLLGGYDDDIRSSAQAWVAKSVAASPG